MNHLRIIPRDGLFLGISHSDCYYAFYHWIEMNAISNAGCLEKLNVFRHSQE